LYFEARFKVVEEELIKWQQKSPLVDFTYKSMKCKDYKIED
jgi:hypothetical protein